MDQKNLSEKPEEAYKDRLYRQIKEAYKRVACCYKIYRAQAGRIQTSYRIVRWIQIILSAVSAGGFVGTVISNQLAMSWIGGISSTVLLVVVACIRDMDAAEQHKRYLDSANRLWLIWEQYRSLLTDFPTLDTEHIVKKRDELQEALARAYQEAPMPGEGSTFLLGGTTEPAADKISG